MISLPFPETYGTPSLSCWPAGSWGSSNITDVLTTLGGVKTLLLKMPCTCVIGHGDVSSCFQLFILLSVYAYVHNASSSCLKSFFIFVLHRFALWSVQVSVLSCYSLLCLWSVQVSVLSCYSFLCPGSLHLMHRWNWIRVNLAELRAIVFQCFVTPVLCSPCGTAVKHTLDCLILSFTTRVLPLAWCWPLELCLNSGSYWLTCSAHYANSLKKFFLTVRVLYVVCLFFFLNRVKRRFFFNFRF